MRVRVIALALGATLLAGGGAYAFSRTCLYNGELAVQVAFFNECFKNHGAVDECQFYSRSQFSLFRTLQSKAEMVRMLTGTCIRGQGGPCEAWAGNAVAALSSLKSAY
jgi:hypothetical protein